MILAIEIGDVRRPKLLRRRAFVADPVGDLFEYGTAKPPVMQVLGAPDRQFSLSHWAVGRSEQVPGIAVLGDRWIVRVFDVSFKRERFGGFAGGRCVSGQPCGRTT